MRFRKKPVEIEAVQLKWETWSDVCDFIGEFPDGMAGVYVHPHENDNYSHDLAWSDARLGLTIPTLEGVMLAVENDFIIRGIQGELYPCKPDIFWASYDQVGD
jgi:hypothetical protein